LTYFSKQKAKYTGYHEDRNNLQQQHGCRLGYIILDSLPEQIEITTGNPVGNYHGEFVVFGKVPIKNLPMLKQNIGKMQNKANINP